MRRESQVPGAYMDFCKKQNHSQHIFSTPHCQNQNVSERKIQDVKHRAVLLLRSSNAPLSFWCYVVMFVADCLKHTAKKCIDWQVPADLLNSSTADMSVFRFKFWQSIEYLQPNARFP